MADLKPCPFCGSADVRDEGTKVACNKCGARAYGNWNDRTEPPATVAAPSSEVQSGDPAFHESGGSLNAPTADAVERAHEIWAMAQVGPNEGVEDAVNRIAAALQPRAVPDEGRLALARLWSIRPSNWQDDDDPEQRDAWANAQRVLAAQPGAVAGDVVTTDGE